MPPRLSQVLVFAPSSRVPKDILEQNLLELQNFGLHCLTSACAPDPNWPHSAGSVESRLQGLMQAFKDEAVAVIWCSRGGYGASDLLPLIDWQYLSTMRPKLVVGFSDISALHSALYSKLGWAGLHGPMPGSPLWGEQSDRSDVQKAVELVKSHLSVTSTHQVGASFALQELSAHSQTEGLAGTLFGGCFSVLTNLIGTPYFPKSLSEHIVFLEDIGENPGRLLRFLNQWKQSGAFDGVKALILGHFQSCARDQSETQALYNEIARRLAIPCFSTDLFGHTSPNLPLVIGRTATIKHGGGKAGWNFVQDGQLLNPSQVSV